MRILAPFPTGKTIIYISGRGINREKVNTEEFIVSPYEDVYNLGVVAGYVKVWKADFAPGCYEQIPNAVAEVSPNSNSLIDLRVSASFPRNKGA